MSESFFPDDLPAKKRHLYVTLWIVAAVCLLLYGIDWVLAQQKSNSNLADSWKSHITIISAILENLIAGVIAAVSLGLTFRWIISVIDPRDRVIEISSGSITERLRKNAQSTRNYVFMGNTASFVTATILPILIDSARDRSFQRMVTLIMIDPTDNNAVSSYAAFKNSVAESQAKMGDRILGKWVVPMYSPRTETSDDVIAKLISSIYIATFASLQKDMNVSIFLRRSFTPFRADMSDSEVVLTQESASESAVAFSSTGHFHSWYHKEADAQKKQAVSIDLSQEQSNLRTLNLAHPKDGKLKVEKSIEAVLKQFAYLNKFVGNKKVIKLATEKVVKPSRVYG